MKPSLFLFFFILSFCGFTQNQKIYKTTKFLALGDSYTIGESVSEVGRWPNQLMDSLRLLGITGPDAKIIATTGWRTDQLKNAILNSGLDDTFNLVSVLIGVNNQYQSRNINQQRIEFAEILDLAIQKAGGDTDKVFVVSIPDYAFTPFGQSKNPSEISAELDIYNAINDSISNVYAVNYFDITPISREGLNNTSLVASDGLHPSAFQYSKWVSLILKRISIVEQTLSTNPSKSLIAKIQYDSKSNTLNIKNDSFRFSINDSISIYDLSGKLVHQEVISNQVNQIALPLLKQGNYLIKVTGFEALQVFIPSR